MAKMNYPALTAMDAAGHPDNGAYDTDVQLAADEMNAENITVPKTGPLSGDAMFNAHDPAEYDLLSTGNKALWVSFTGKSEVDPFGAANVALVSAIFGNPSVTLTNLNALRQESISHATQNGLPVISVTHLREARGEYKAIRDAKTLAGTLGQAAIDADKSVREALA